MLSNRDRLYRGCNCTCTTYLRRTQVLPLPRTPLSLANDKREDNQVEEGHDFGLRVNNDVVSGGADSQVRRVRCCDNRIRVLVDKLRSRRSSARSIRLRRGWQPSNIDTP